MDQKHAEVHARAAEISIDLTEIKRIVNEQKEINEINARNDTIVSRIILAFESQGTEPCQWWNS